MNISDKWALLGGAVGALCLLPAPVLAQGQPAGAEPPAARMVVSYFEAAPGQAGALGRMLRGYAAKLSGARAHPRTEVLAEQGRPERLVVIESWPAGVAPDDGARAALEQAAEPLVQAPVDSRAHGALTELLPASARGPFHMLMHVDVVPAGAEMGAKVLAAQRASVLAAGALGFEAATQAGKPNHFAIHEVWASRAAYQAYAATPAGRALRTQLATAKGALFDDRFYVVPGGGAGPRRADSMEPGK